MIAPVRRFLTFGGPVGAAVGLYLGLVSGRLAIDLGVGRTVRPLGPLQIDMNASREVVFRVIADPYLGSTPHALAGKLEVIERGTDMVLAAHHTPIRWGLKATTLETVHFDPPESIHFQLVRGPVPYVVEDFVLHESEGNTRLHYRGELGADLWAVGRWWGGIVAARWEEAVAASFESIRTEAERRAHSIQA